MTFEESLAKLNKIKDDLDSPDITLDASLKLFEESVECSKKCLEMLKSSEGKIVAIKSEMDKLVEKPFISEEE